MEITTDNKAEHRGTPEYCIPVDAPSGGMLYLSVPVSGAQQVIQSALHGLGAGYEELRRGTLAVRVESGSLDAIGSALADVLSAVELAETQTLYLTDGAETELPDLLRSQPLSRLVTRLRSDRVDELLRDGRLVTHFQPIVYTGQPSIVFGYECLTRGFERDGGLVSPAQLFADAAAGGLLIRLDERAREQAIRSAAAVHSSGRLFINCTPASLCEAKHDHRRLLKVLADVGRSPHELVLEIVESEAIDDTARLDRVLDNYRASGVKIALDDLGAGYSSLNLVAEIRPDFVKLDRALVRDVDRFPLKATFARKLLEAAREAEIEVIAEGVETLAEWRWLRLYGADYVQGYLFASPDACPPIPRDPARQSS